MSFCWAALDDNEIDEKLLCRILGMQRPKLVFAPRSSCRLGAICICLLGYLRAWGEGRSVRVGLRKRLVGEFQGRLALHYAKLGAIRTLSCKVIVILLMIIVDTIPQSSSLCHTSKS